MQTIFINGSIFDGEITHTNKALIIDNGSVNSIVPSSQISRDDNTYNLEGGIIAPGFIDLQVNGGGGVMFNDAPNITTLRTMIESHRTFGTTNLFPTLISTNWDTMIEAAGAVRSAIHEGLPGICGIHFEGPYLSKERKGVHDETIIRSLDKGAIELLSSQDMGTVITTIAPENVPNDAIITLHKNGVKICAGHSAATYEEMQQAFECGVEGITHLFNAMSQFESRSPGVVGAALENRDCWCGIIVDGYHTHQATLRTALKAKPMGKMILITDAMATVGATDKKFILNGEEIVAKDGRCATANGTLAGSDLDMASAVRNTVKMLRQPVGEALRMASLYPAQFIGMSDFLGRISPGYQADLVHLSKDLIPINTWIGGKL